MNSLEHKLHLIASKKVSFLEPAQSSGIIKKCWFCESKNFKNEIYFVISHLKVG
jgi:hypothetical protein